MTDMKMTLLKSTHDPTYSTFASCFEMDESGQSRRENRKQGRISEKRLWEMHGKHTNTLIFQKEKTSFNTNFPFFTTFLLYRDKRRGVKATSRVTTVTFHR